MTAARRAAAAPRPTLPAPASARPRFKRLNVDLHEGEHHALKRWALDARVDVSALVRALLILAGNTDLRTEAETLARQLVDERKAARR
jgi:hypothetical protein